MNTKLMNRVEDLFLEHDIKFNQLDLIDLTNDLNDCIDKTAIRDLERELDTITYEKDHFESRVYELERQLEDEKNHNFVLSERVKALGGKV